MISPSRFQWKVWWLALTVLAMAIIVSGIVTTGGYLIFAMGYLQPVVLPLAVAGILAYLLDPVVTWLTRRRWSRIWAVIAVFATVIAIIASLVVWVVPSINRQSDAFRKNLPAYSKRAQELMKSTIESTKHFAERIHPPTNGEEEDPFNAAVQKSVNDGITAVQEKAGEWLGNAGAILQRGIGASLGALGLLLSLVLVPIFLFFFLKEGPKITATWSKYLPLRASPLKSEVVSLLSEINSYLISFFRGQLLVSLIDGFLIGTALLVMGLDFAVLIGLLVGVLGLIPYAGMLICWIPAVLIAIAQFGDWGHPLAVTIIFIAMNQIDGLFIAPKIVGESVGLHPLTVIVSVLAWSIVLGGLLGALLAVPLTATLKVLLKRYFWDRDPSLQPASGAPPG
ncbi:MAG: AI-2E family transporter [Terrimicrobiaceae bacterium]|nr:AI-2E family transporter [Terrimicrobiaceae bacterium]